MLQGLKDSDMGSLAWLGANFLHSCSSPLLAASDFPALQGGLQSAPGVVALSIQVTVHVIGVFSLMGHCRVLLQ